jgi:hypothetical protein
LIPAFAAFAAVATVARAARANPTPRPTPNPFVLNGYARAYDFTRQNASGGYRAVNQASFEAALSAHAAYNFTGGLTIGASYLFADPLGTCDIVTDHEAGSSCIVQRPPNTSPDDTLPGYQLGTLYEAYAQYARGGLFVRAGNQVINTPWANASDSRVKPVAFQGADVAYASGPWTVEGMDMLRFQSRTSSFFTRTTLLTSYPPTGNSGLGGNFTPPGNIRFASSDPFGAIETGGFAFGRIAYAARGLSGDVDYYAIQDIADMLWIDGKYAWPARAHPFVAVQIGSERNAGRSVIGKIDSQIYGLQAGANVTPSVQVVAGYDAMPWHDDFVTLPPGVTCSSSTHLLHIPTPAGGSYTFPYFIPNNAPQCVPGSAKGTAQILYGGWASPYTDSYVSDPMFTTEMTQSVADRHVAGNSLREAVVFTSADRRFVGQLSHAQYDAGNIGGNETSYENDADAMYFVNRVVPGQRYRGLLLRYRYGERFFNETRIYGGIPLFKYSRAQVEYDF